MRIPPLSLETRPVQRGAFYKHRRIVSAGVVSLILDRWNVFEAALLLNTTLDYFVILIERFDITVDRGLDFYINNLCNTIVLT